MSSSLRAGFALLCLVLCMPAGAQKAAMIKPKVVYKSAKLIVTRISEHGYEHTSYKQTQDFGNVPCNGLVVSDSGEAIVFDTPVDDASSEELIAWIQNTLHDHVKGVIPTHFHDDCLGGLKAFHDHAIPSYAYVKTVALAKEHHYVVPENSFSDSLVLRVGAMSVTAAFFGEGHTKDNVVGYVPSERILFGGCLIKERGAQKGYLGDANVAAWSHTVEQVKQAYPAVQLVIPGHGDYGNRKLLDYTIRLFEVK